MQRLKTKDRFVVPHGANKAFNHKTHKINMFSVPKFEDDILGGIRLPRDVNGQSLIQGTHRRTPYGDLFNVAVVPVDGVGAVTKRRKAPDDATYARYPVLYDLIPRICVIQVGEDGCYHKAAFALPKFNALTPVDEDDRQEGENDAEVSSTSLQVPGVLCYQAQEKANGHTVTFCLLPGASLLLAGTKGCAWLCKLEDGTLSDDAIESCNPPTEMVRDAFQCMQHLLRGDPAGVLAVLRTGRVLVGERETNQHIRYYKTPGIMFFDDDLPEIFKRPETRGPFAIEDITPALLHGLRGGGNSEGWVLCGMDSSGKILIRFKFKTVAYTCLRTARESFDPLDGLNLTLSKWHVRIHERNRFLHVHPRYMDEIVFEGFLAPLAKYMYAQNVTRQDIAYSSTGFAPVIESFRVATGLSDEFHPPPPCNSSEVLEYGLQKVKRSAAEEAKSGSRGGRGGVLVTTVAMPPGSGKTTFMALAAAAVPGSVHMSQDQYSPYAEKFYEALAMHLESGCVVFLHRSCFDGKDRRRVFGVAARAKASVVAIQPCDSMPPLQLYTALRGVLLRETHETLGEGVSDDVRVLVAGGFWSQCVPVAHKEFSGAVKATIVPVQLHCDSAVTMLTPELLAEVQAFVCEIRARRPFDTKTPLSDAAAYAGLFKSIREGPELRKAAEDVAAEVLRAYHLQVGGGGAAETRCSVLYASIDLDPEHTTRLLADIFREGTTATTSADHVTLVYQPSSKQADALSRFLGTRVRVRVRKCVAAPDGGIVACDAEVLDAGELAEYLPEHAHMTVAWTPDSYRPVDSHRLFDGSMPGAVESDFAMEANGTVKFHYFKN